MRKAGWIIPALVLLACTKSEQPPLSFRMNGALYAFEQVDRATGEDDCRARVYEIAAYQGSKFFKINFSAKDTLTPGIYTMGSTPSNSDPGTATFWYTSNGSSYTARPFVVTVHSYKNKRIRASFAGGTVSDGLIDMEILER